MGNINIFDVGDIKSKFNLQHYVETGTGTGECLSHVLKYPFETFYSIEIYEPIYTATKDKIDALCTTYNRNANLFLGESFKVLPVICEELEDAPYGAVLFFMDAHFPGADLGLETYESEKNDDIRIPLESELRAIVENRNVKNDVFIIDDLRIYEDGPFKEGNWKDRATLGAEGIGFIDELFSNTHNVERLYEDQGYIVLTPMGHI